MDKLNVQNYQWIFDLVFGLALITPLILMLLNVVGQQIVLLTIGVAIGYIIHVSQKMVIFNDLIKTARREAEQKADEEVEKKVKQKTDEENLNQE